ncbi:MAG: hypothetical protein V4684_02950 [Pseudomonadota bacterium]
MGFQGGGGVNGTIVGANRTARLWFASILIAAAAICALYRVFQEPALPGASATIQASMTESLN